MLLRTSRRYTLKMFNIYILLPWVVRPAFAKTFLNLPKYSIFAKKLGLLSTSC